MMINYILIYVLIGLIIFLIENRVREVYYDSLAQAILVVVIFSLLWPWLLIKHIDPNKKLW